MPAKKVQVHCAVCNTPLLRDNRDLLRRDNFYCKDHFRKFRQRQFSYTKKNLPKPELEETIA